MKNILETEFSQSGSTFDLKIFYGFNNNILTLVDHVWNSAKGKQVWEERYENSILIPEGFEHFCENIDRFGGEEYEIKEEDYLKRYKGTRGIIGFYSIVDNTKLNFAEVGGAKYQRKKWIIVSNDANIVYFLVSTVDFNQVLYEDYSKNRLEDSLEAWKLFQRNVLYRKQRKILLFTKVDLLEKKIKYFLEKRISLKKDFYGLEYDETDTVEIVKSKIMNWFEVEFLKGVTNEENISHIFINTLDKTVVDDIYTLTRRDIFYQEFLKLN